MGGQVPGPRPGRFPAARPVGDPGPALFQDAGLDAEVDDLAGQRDALAVPEVELDLAEGPPSLSLTTLTRFGCRACVRRP